MEFKQKEKYDINDLLEITRILRGENGCVWDREQNHKTIRMNVLEEAYEVMEAIDSDDAAALKEELGDLLFQAVFHCQIEDERGRFKFDDICDDVAKKMIYRHPHVFGTVSVENSDEVLKNWDKLKKKSKEQQTVSDTLDSVPKLLPALMRGAKVGKRVSNAGFDYSDAGQVLEILKQNISDIELAISDNNDEKIDEDFGNILFACCNLSRFIKKDSEKVLTFAINKFIMQFRAIEQGLIEAGKQTEDLSDEQRAEIWSELTKQA